jgi:hypothetical protein
VFHFCRCSPAKHPKRSDAILARLNELARPFEIKISSALPTFVTNIKNVRLYNRKAEWSLVSRDLKWGPFSHIARDPLLDDTQIDT